MPTCGHLAMGSQTSAASAAAVVSCCLRSVEIYFSLSSYCHRSFGFRNVQTTLKRHEMSQVVGRCMSELFPADPKTNHFFNKVISPINPRNKPSPKSLSMDIITINGRFIIGLTTWRYGIPINSRQPGPGGRFCVAANACAGA